MAEHRAKALSGYVQGLYDFGSAKMMIDFEPEDWAGLEKRLQTIDVEAKDELLAVVRADEPKDLDKKEWKLRQVAGGAPYRYILQTVYPALRHSDYVVQYKIRNFTADEAKELLYSDPKQLSLNEMFQVAQTYEPGSDAFCEVFEIAVRMFPDDPERRQHGVAIGPYRPGTSLPGQSPGFSPETSGRGCRPAFGRKPR